LGHHPVVKFAVRNKNLFFRLSGKS
jgi:hypothetical protein